jgi:hypothetical protein
MTRVHLREATVDNFGECIGLAVEKAQEGLVASNTRSLAESSVNPTLFPLVIYNAAVVG